MRCGGYFRRDVRHGSEHIARRRHGDLGGRACQTKVGDLCRAVGWNEDVLWLNVAVDHADAVGGTQSLKGIGRVAQGLGNSKGALRAQQLAQVRSVDEFHDEEALTGDDTLVEDGDDTGVHDACCGSCLAAEACDEVLGVRQVRVHDLEGDGSIKAFVLCDVHGGHAATREPARHSVPFVDEEADQRVRLVECLFIAHLLDSMGVFAKLSEVPTSVRRVNGVVLRS